MYQITGIGKWWERDTPDGCDPNTTKTFEIDVHFYDKTPAGVVKKFADFLGVKVEDVELNACEEPGRIEVYRHENAAGDPLPKPDFRKEVYYCTYTAWVEQVMPVRL